MARFIKKFIAAALTAAALIATLTACGGNTKISDARQNIAIVYSNTASSAHLDPEAIRDELQTACIAGSEYGTYFNVISLEGEPRSAYNMTIKPDEKQLSASRKKKNAAKLTDEVMNAISGIRPLTEEQDPLEAMRIAAAAIRDREGEKTIYFFADGISTVEKWNMSKYTNGIVNSVSNVDELIAVLQEQQLIPDLTDMQVVLLGVGKVSGEQETLTDSDIDTLKTLWIKIVEAGGGTASMLSADPIETDTAALPLVSTVPVKEGKVVIDFEFDENNISFISNTAELKDKTAAEAALTEVADQLKKNPTCCVLVLGTTATGQSKERCMELSQQRAETVCELLTGMGVSSSQFIAKGGGYSTEGYHVKDIDEATGNLIEEKAKENRKVYIMDVETAREKELM